MPDPGLPIADMGPDPDAEMHRAPTPRAADLPDGTVVADERRAWIKYPYNTEYYPWQATTGAASNDRNVDEALAAGARVLRYGLGSDS